ncbi:uncharacterized protein LOC134845142 [Symsagittifera roscoffensis]|uniref:uncharacterized protein LOC134845142 n=1 Tax=Symsagittifera roscoffensis TaxID=84072 RepID=UPI00307BB919
MSSSGGPGDAFSFRLVVLGSGKVGKTSIISRLLYNSFPDKYTETVEDLHSRTFKRDGRSCEVSVLDTAGELQFPAMRRLSISSAHGFLLIYEVTQPNSLELLKHTITEIQQERGEDLKLLPTVLVGNKIDQEIWHEILKEDVEQYLRDTGLDWPVVEVSAKWNLHMDQLLSVMFAQWRPTYPPHPSPISPTNPNSRSGLSIPPSIALHSPSHGPETRDTDDDLKLCRTVSMKNPSELKDASSFNKPPKKNSKHNRGSGPIEADTGEKSSAVRSLSMYGRRLSTSLYRRRGGSKSPTPTLASDSEESSRSGSRHASTGSVKYSAGSGTIPASPGGSGSGADSCKVM